MLLDEAGEVVEMFKSSFPLSLMFFIPIFILISPVSPVGAAHDFAVYRMQHYDLQGTSYGCRSAVVSVEARAVESKAYTRRCVIARLAELSAERFRDMVSQNAGALLVLLPADLQQLSPEDKQHLLEVEQELMAEETPMPVFFTPETAEVASIYDDVRRSVHNDQAGSAAEALLGSASANGFQMVVNGPNPKAMEDFKVVNIYGKLAGFGIEEQLPTIVIVAHYDAYGIAPSLAFGGDSNGSGVIALLELSRLFSKLYTNSRTHAKYNLVFLLSGAGKFNYQGSKKFLEEQLDGADGSLLSDVAYVLCLDTIGNDNKLHLHVSKPPKPGSQGEAFFQALQSVAEIHSPNTEVSMKHKKINLADEYLAWEHEKYSIRRMPAFTLSHLDSHKEPERATILDTSLDTDVLERNVKIIAEALARHIYNISSSSSQTDIFQQGLRVEREVVEAWSNYLTGHPRAAQLLPPTSPVTATLHQAMAKYLKDVHMQPFSADNKDPEFVFYSGHTFTMDAFSVKPAVFDLFLALAIAAYLSIIYVFVQNFGGVYGVMKKLQISPDRKAKKA